MDATAAADYMCACGHRVGAHDAPPAPGQPWGQCREIAFTTGWTGEGQDIRRCYCREAWPKEDD
jgi:hypothetical protein